MILYHRDEMYNPNLYVTNLIGGPEVEQIK